MTLNVIRHLSEHAEWHDSSDVTVILTNVHLLNAILSDWIRCFALNVFPTWIGETEAAMRSEAYLETLNAKNFTALADFIAEDAVYIPPGLPDLEGRDGKITSSNSVLYHKRP